MNEPLSDIEIVRAVFDYFGEETQRRKLLEECHEYIESMSFSTDKNDANDGEIADIFIVALQLYLESPNIQEIVRGKITRVLKRIAEKYYDSHPAYREN